jgi:hypothetical protein
LASCSTYSIAPREGSAKACFTCERQFNLIQGTREL